MKAIVNVNRSWAIGFEGSLLINIPEDMKYFRTVTMGKTVIMGRKTLESFPGGKPLKGRTNIVLTSDPGRINTAAEAPGIPGSSSQGTGLIIVKNREEALDAAARYASGSDDIYVIGGASIYRLFLNDCSSCLVTVNDCTAKADTYFPDLRREPGWYIAQKGETKEYKGIHYSFDIWKKTAVVTVQLSSEGGAGVRDQGPGVRGIRLRQSEKMFRL